MKKLIVTGLTACMLLAIPFGAFAGVPKSSEVKANTKSTEVKKDTKVDKATKQQEKDTKKESREEVMKQIKDLQTQIIAITSTVPEGQELTVEQKAQVDALKAQIKDLRDSLKKVKEDKVKKEKPSDPVVPVEPTEPKGV